MNNGRIVLGLGGTVDHEIVWDLEKVQALAARMGVTMDEVEDEPSTEADNARGALVFLLQMMSRGCGGECHVRDAESLTVLDREFESRTTLGGTCVRAAIAMNRIGIPSTVHLVSINEEVRRLLPRRVERICSASADSFEPHVILQFPAGAKVLVEDGSVQSKRANRVILVNDRPNELMELSPGLGPTLSNAGAVMISGFNTMKSADLLRERLASLREMLSSVPTGVPIVYEDAGFHDGDMRDIVLETIPALVDIHSLNEDEASTYLGRPLDVADGARLAHAMEELLLRLQARTVLLHTSHYAAVLGEKAETIAAAADVGCRMASTRFAHGDAFTRADFEATTSVPRDPIGSVLVSAPDVVRRGVHVTPSYDVKAASPTTIGLGDTFIGGLMAALGAPDRISEEPTSRQ